jgi:drug/metabolite transporter (DMT)-like permease
MTVSPGVAYGLLAATAWGGVLFLKKRYFDDYASEVFMPAVFYAGFLWYVPVFALIAPPDLGLGALGAIETAFVVGTLLGLAFGLLLAFAAIDRGDVSYVAPISKLTPAFVLPLEIVLLGEHLGPLQIVGIALATAAVYLANYHGTGLLAPLGRAWRSRPARLALLSALVVAFVNLGQRLVLQDVSLYLPVWVGLKLLCVPVLLTPIALRRGIDATRRQIVGLLAVGGVLAAGEYLVSLTFATLPASVATPLVGLQAIVAVILGGVVLGEERFTARLGAAVVAVLAIGFIAAG